MKLKVPLVIHSASIFPIPHSILVCFQLAKQQSISSKTPLSVLQPWRDILDSLPEDLLFSRAWPRYSEVHTVLWQLCHSGLIFMRKPQCNRVVTTPQALTGRTQRKCRSLFICCWKISKSYRHEPIFPHAPSFNCHTGSKKFYHMLTSQYRVFFFQKRLFLKPFEESKCKVDEKKKINSEKKSFRRAGLPWRFPDWGVP